MDTSVYFKINTPRVIYETIDQEAIIIDFDTGIYYSVDRIGSEIWSIIEKGATVSQITDAISRRYSGERIMVGDGVARFITQLEQENIIVRYSKEPDEVSLETQVKNANETGQPTFKVPTLSKYSDMQELLLLDPIHEVDETGWPTAKTESLNENGESNLQSN